MVTFTLNTDTTRGLFIGTADPNIVDWLIISGSAYTAPPGQFALTISLQDYTFGAAPNHSIVSLSAWSGILRNELFNVNYTGYIDNVIAGAGGDKIIGHDGGVLGNYIQGDDIFDAGGNDWIDGKGGHDTLLGTGGSDTIYGGDGNDALYGDWDLTAQDQGNFAAGSDQVFGGSGEDTLFVDQGDDTLDGGIGYDFLNYSGFFDDFGNTTYRVTVNLTSGTATVLGTDTFDMTTSIYGTQTVSGFEHVMLTAGDDVIYAQTPASVLFPPTMWIQAGAGNDKLFGGTELDQMYGGTGNDTLRGGGAPDSNGQTDFLYGGAGNDIYALLGDANLVENAAEGIDTVQIGYVTNHTLLHDFENLTLLAAAAASNGTGNNLANTVLGNAFNNRLLGLDGNDTLSGGAGNDSLEGGTGQDRLLGGVGNDRLLGGTGNDVLIGDLGNDSVYGGTGNDTLQGGNDADLLQGGLGRDELSGGAGADRFIFASAAEAGLGGQRDRIIGFISHEDQLNLKTIAAGQTYLNSNPFDGHAGQVRYDAVTGILQGDVNGDSVVDYEINLGVGTVLVAGDLIL